MNRVWVATSLSVMLTSAAIPFTPACAAAAAVPSSTAATGRAAPTMNGGTSVAPPRDEAIDPFELTATERDFKDYTPTYLANGYWSMASSLSGTGATPAQMVGVMDYTASDVSRPAAIPSWNEIDYYDGAEWLNAHAVSAASHSGYRQTLDMRNGSLDTRYRWRGRTHDTDVAVSSFVSMSDPHLAAVSLRLTPRFTGTIRLRFTLRAQPPPPRLPLAQMSVAEFEAAAAASNQPDLSSGGKRGAIWYLGELDSTSTGHDDSAKALWMEGTAIAGRTVAVGAAVELPPHFDLQRTSVLPADHAQVARAGTAYTGGGAPAGEAPAVAAPTGATPVVENYAVPTRALATTAVASGALATPAVAAQAVVLEAEGRVRSGHSYRFTKFVAASATGWELGSAGTAGAGARAAAAAAQARSAGLQGLLAAHEAAWHELWRSDILVGGNSELQRTVHSDLFYLLENSTPDTSWAAAACGFSGNYFGHVFWDNDFWVYPALLLLHPERAKSLIAFRQRTLPQALARARAHGFAGAMYPWEADPWSGADVTPKFAVENADREIHVNGAVALAQWQYYLATGDRRWLRDEAFPVIKAVADFWASRAARSPAGRPPEGRRYEILDVTSPEEDYVHVNNEIYTNEVAHRSLLAAVDAAAVLGEPPDPRWRDVADGLFLPAAGRNGNYFDFDPTTAHDKTSSWMATSVPMLSIPALDFDADAGTLRGLFKHSLEAVGPIRGRANQMVLVMLAIQAAAVGDANYFNEFLGGRGGAADPFLKPPFNVRSETPQNDSVYLLATSGGFIQAFLFGLSGVRIESQGLVGRYPPTLPPQMTSLELKNIAFRGKRLDVAISRLPSGQVVRQVHESHR